jgi:uncharacterized OB-fold protein
LSAPADPALKYVLRELGPAAREFYRRLADDELSTTFCATCDRFSFPPRQRCAECGGTQDWRRLSGRGEVYAFTAQERGLRFTAPEVVGIAELDEGVRVFGVFDESLGELEIGAPLEVHLRRDVSGLTLLGFRLRIDLDSQQ